MTKSLRQSEKSPAAPRPSDGDAEPRRQAEAEAGSPNRVVIEGVSPEIDAARYPIKRIVGDIVVVRADVFTDGHDHITASLLHRRAGDARWQEVPMQALVNDRWEGRFAVAELGEYEYTLQAGIDHFGTWSHGLSKKVEAGQDVSSELLEGAELVRAAAARTEGANAAWLRAQAGAIGGGDEMAQRAEVALSPQLAAAMSRHPDRSILRSYERITSVVVERERAATGAWYEMFPRSSSPEPGRHGTFKDCEARLPYVASMGFDVIYLPPVHPIGTTHRKGANNAPEAEPGDAGSPWGIGAADGGHKAVHHELGTLADFRHFVEAARGHGIEIALDIAFQCSPDHPYVKQHPKWFRWRPDGTIQYAENPPKRYQDIYPLNFESEEWRELWEELKSVVLFWIEQGVSIFRVDNPHTKPFAFWEWLIREVRREHPDAVFLAEAFTRPKVMKSLAKGGYSQSYSYFTWRNTKAELTEYFTELTQTECREYMRANLFTNTPDILHEYLQHGGRPAFQIRLVLAATLAGTYGIYGPPFELCVGQAVGRSEEYLDSEKYQIRNWNLDQPGNIRDFIARVNEIRRDNAGLGHNSRLQFCSVDNDQIICYARTAPDLSNIILVVVNLDPHQTQTGWVNLPLADLDLDPGQPFQVHDLLSDARYLWNGATNYVALDPHVVPAHIFRLRRRIRSERDFEYFA